MHGFKIKNSNKSQNARMHIIIWHYIDKTNIVLKINLIRKIHLKIKVLKLSLHLFFHRIPLLKIIIMRLAWHIKIKVWEENQFLVQLFKINRLKIYKKRFKLTKSRTLLKKQRIISKNVNTKQKTDKKLNRNLRAWTYLPLSTVSTKKKNWKWKDFQVIYRRSENKMLLLRLSPKF